MKPILLFFVFIVLVTRAKAQIQNNTQLQLALDSVFSTMPDASTPGAAISILQNGKVIARHSYGRANLEHLSPFSHQTPVRLLYSGSREFMCAGLALMEKEGLLKFTDYVKTYFPKLPSWSNRVTIQDLLNHSSGFDDEWGTMLLMQASMDNRVDNEQLLDLLYNQPTPQVEPGKGYMYSNSDFALLRMIMEQASKKKLPAYLEEKLFRPLGMSGTSMNDQLDKIIPGLADNYYGEGNYFKQTGTKTSPGGNYRIVTTATDLEKWAMAIEDSTSFLASAFQRLYKNARPIPVLSPEIHYVFGHEWDHLNNTAIIRHGGVNGDFYMTRIPPRKITIIGLGNSFQNMAAAMNLVHVILGKKEVSNLVPLTIADNVVQSNKKKWENYAGRYMQQSRPGHSSHLPIISFYDIKLSGDSLLFYFNSKDHFVMMPVGNDLFKDPDYGAIIAFTGSDADSSKKMVIRTSDGGIMNFKKSYEIFNTSRDYLQQFTGQYHSKHLDFYCRITFNETNQLVIRRPTISDKILVPDGKDRFLFEMESGGSAWYVSALFTRNRKGQIDGINMQHVRMMHHRFERVP